MAQDSDASKSARRPEKASPEAAPAELEQRARDVLADQPGAWPAFVRDVTPRIAAMARGQRSLRARKLAGSVDDIAEITTSALERLARNGYRNLKRFVALREAGAQADFDSWLYGCVDFAVREHLRKRFGRAPRARDGAHGGPSRRDLGTLAERLDEVPLDRAFVSTLGATKRVTVAEIFAYAAANFAAPELRALELFYLEDKSSADVAALLGLADERQADKLIRKLNARLRYRFAADS